MKRFALSASVIALCAALASCAADTTPAIDGALVETPEIDETAAEIAEATAFVKRAETELAALSKVTALAYWANATNITDETDAAAAEAGAKMTKLSVSLANESKKYNVDIMPYDVARKIRILRSGITIPAPSREGAAEELSAITTDLSSTCTAPPANTRKAGALPPRPSVPRPRSHRVRTANPRCEPRFFPYH